MKAFDSELMPALFGLLDSFIGTQYPANSRDMALEEILKLCIRLINFANINCKMKGITIINKMKTKHTTDTMYWENLHQYSKKLVEHNIIRILFGGNLHEEAIKRSVDIISLILNCHDLNKEHLHLIWKCCINIREEISRPSFELLTKLMNDFTEIVKCLIYKLTRNWASC